MHHARQGIFNGPAPSVQDRSGQLLLNARKAEQGQRRAEGRAACCRYLTSRWLLEVRKTRPILINWHVMSLAVLNEARLDQLPEHIRDLKGRAWARSES
jgi:hypothetical protein